MDKEVTKDIVQDSFLKLWECKENVQFQAALSWLFTTSYRISLRYLEKRKRRMPESSIPIQETYQPQTDTQKIVQDIFDGLSERQRSILMLRYYEEYSYEEIGNILQISESQVKVYLFRGRQKVKEVIKSLDRIL
jgi:RNA polymerase sigma-70 factor (ECF subfamily)